MNNTLHNPVIAHMKDQLSGDNQIPPITNTAQAA